MKRKSTVDSVIIPHGLKNAKVEPPKSAEKLEPPEHPPHLFPLHTLAAFIGSRGSGKTNACIQLAKEYVEDETHPTFSRVFIISPTYDSNPQFKVLPILEEDVYRDGLKAQAALTDILHKVEEDVKDWKLNQEYTKIYKKHKFEKICVYVYVILYFNNFFVAI
jgi:KaiC/GvpD/RAD55 family RecA-like ATPase